jgi:hypothetical protein
MVLELLCLLDALIYPGYDMPKIAQKLRKPSPSLADAVARRQPANSLQRASRGLGGATNAAYMVTAVLSSRSSKRRTMLSATIYFAIRQVHRSRMRWHADQQPSGFGGRLWAWAVRFGGLYGDQQSYPPVLKRLIMPATILQQHKNIPISSTRPAGIDPRTWNTGYRYDHSLSNKQHRPRHVFPGVAVTDIQDAVMPSLGVKYNQIRTPRCSPCRQQADRINDGHGNQRTRVINRHCRQASEDPTFGLWLTL